MARRRVTTAVDLRAHLLEAYRTLEKEWGERERKSREYYSVPEHRAFLERFLGQSLDTLPPIQPPSEWAGEMVRALEAGEPVRVTGDQIAYLVGDRRLRSEFVIVHPDNSIEVIPSSDYSNAC